ncbi:MAG TPA: hypothetical protein DCM08_05875 [Microscillaceae bacterium]|jgi:hypothetical protein|nr:hypothetical protein [Microscillaceae bacterium]
MKLHPKLKKSIKKAFVIGDKTFYQFEHALDMPVARWHFAGLYKEEADRGLSRVELDQALAQMKNLLNAGDLVSAGAIVNELQYRNKYLYDLELMYKLASVVFFELDEELTEYDSSYNAHKINLFKTLPMDGFFFDLPMKHLMPFQLNSGGDTQNILRVMQERLNLGRKILAEIP